MKNKLDSIKYRISGNLPRQTLNENLANKFKHRGTKKCARCGSVNYFNLTELESAFSSESDKFILKATCLKCGETEYGSMSSPSSGFISDEMFNYWGINNDVCVSPQDEEIILAVENQDIDRYLQGLENNLFLPEKRHRLMQALCVMLYDNYSSKGDQAVVDRLVTELRSRIDLVKVSNPSDYIKKVVYPLLGIDKDN